MAARKLSSMLAFQISQKVRVFTGRLQADPGGFRFLRFRLESGRPFIPGHGLPIIVTVFQILVPPECRRLHHGFGVFSCCGLFITGQSLLSASCRLECVPQGQVHLLQRGQGFCQISGQGCAQQVPGFFQVLFTACSLFPAQTCLETCLGILRLSPFLIPLEGGLLMAGFGFLQAHPGTGRPNALFSRLADQAGCPCQIHSRPFPAFFQKGQFPAAFRTATVRRFLVQGTDFRPVRFFFLPEPGPLFQIPGSKDFPGLPVSQFRAAPKVVQGPFFVTVLVFLVVLEKGLLEGWGMACLVGPFQGFCGPFYAQFRSLPIILCGLVKVLAVFHFRPGFIEFALFHIGFPMAPFGRRGQVVVFRRSVLDTLPVEFPGRIGIPQFCRRLQPSGRFFRVPQIPAHKSQPAHGFPVPHVRSRLIRGRRLLPVSLVQGLPGVLFEIFHLGRGHCLIRRGKPDIIEADLFGCKIQGLRPFIGKLEMVTEPVIRNMFQFRIEGKGLVAGIDQHNPFFLIPFRILPHQILESRHFPRGPDGLAFFNAQAVHPIGKRDVPFLMEAAP